MRLHETGLLFKCFSEKTRAFQSKKCVAEKLSREKESHCHSDSSLVTASMTWENLPLCVIRKYPKSRYFKGALLL